MERQTVVWKSTGVKVIYEALEWVSRAMGKDPWREWLDRMLVEEGVILATDGKRLHKLEGDALPQIAPGLYRVEKIKGAIVLNPEEDEKMSFLDWRRVMPTGEPRISLEVDGEGRNDREMILGRMAAELGVALSEPREGVKGYFNIHFLKPLLGRGWRVEVWGNDKAVRFESGSKEGILYTALIMPAVRG